MLPCSLVKMAPVEVKLFFSFIGVWGRGGKAPRVCGGKDGL